MLFMGETHEMDFPHEVASGKWQEAPAPACRCLPVENSEEPVNCVFFIHAGRQSGPRRTNRKIQDGIAGPYCLKA
jgi:hypothetical protein